jgi:hypothetical protein
MLRSVNTPHSPLRRLVRTSAAALALAVTCAALPAQADVPEGWSDPAPVDGMHALIVLVAIPLALFVGITLLVLAPSLARGERGAHRGGSAEWFGGPRSGVEELPAAEEPSETGGGSGRW